MRRKTRSAFAIITSISTFGFASNGSHGAITLWTTTFTDNSSGANTGRAMANTPSAPFGDDLTAAWTIARSGTASPLFLTGTENGANNFNPRQNVDNAAGVFWQADFSFSGGTSTIDLSSATFNIYRFNNAGAMQGTDSNLRTVDFSAWYTVNGGTDWIQMGAVQNVNTTESHTSNLPESRYIALNFALPAPAAVDFAADDFQIRFRAENDSTNAGANIGINSFSVNTIPEPGVAMLGALGLVGLLCRRR